MKIILPSFNVCEDIIEYFNLYSQENKITEDKIIAALGKTPSYVKRSITFLLQVGILTEKKLGDLSRPIKSIVLNDKYDKFIKNGGAEEGAIKLAITNNPVFKEYNRIRQKGKNEKQSAQYVISSNNLDITPSELIKNLNGWIKYLNKTENKANASSSTIVDKEKHGFMWVDKNGDLIYDEKTHNEFILGQIKKEKKNLGEGSVYVDPQRIKQLQSIDKSKFDLSKLIRKCEELNIAYSTKCFFSVGMLTRAITDHVPPIFGKKTFSEVAGGYGTKSFKDSMVHLDKSSRKIADSFLHTHIRQKETLPTKTQVNFSSDLDVLLGEVIRILI